MHFWTALNKVDFLRFKFHPRMDALKFKLNPNVDFLELRFTQIYRQRGSSQFKIYSQYGSSPFQIYSQQFQFQMSQELQRCRMRQELQRSWRLGTNHLKYHMRLVYRICNSFKEDMLLVYWLHVVGIKNIWFVQSRHVIRVHIPCSSCKEEWPYVVGVNKSGCDVFWYW